MSESEKEALDEMFGNAAPSSGDGGVVIKIGKNPKMVEIPLDGSGGTECDCGDADEPSEDGKAEGEDEVPVKDAKPTALKDGADKFKNDSESCEEMMLRFLMTERNPELLEASLSDGKTIRGAWRYVVSVMKNAYIARNGRVNGGMCASPDVVYGIAERYFREFPEGSVEPDVPHVASVPKKPSVPAKPADTAAAAPTQNAKKRSRKGKIVEVAKKAAVDAKAEEANAEPPVATDDVCLDKYDFSSIL